jgi:imidazolonepropionase-like amidohydrolase
MTDRPAPRYQSLVIRNGRLLTGDALGQAVDADVLIEGGRIREIGPAISRPDTAGLDAQGGYVLPGLIDAHVHLSLGASVRPYAFWQAPPIERDLALYRNGLLALLNGITSVLPTTPWSSMRAWSNAGRWSVPESWRRDASSR